MGLQRALPGQKTRIERNRLSLFEELYAAGCLNRPAARCAVLPDRGLDYP